MTGNMMGGKPTVAGILRELVEEHGFAWAVAATTSGQVLARSGDVAALQWPDLASSLFGDRDAIVRLDQSLDGQTLPQIWSQGEVTASVVKPRRELIIGLFDQSGQDAAQVYLRARRADSGLDRAAIAASLAELIVGRAARTHPGATPAALDQAEQELARRFPDDYRELMLRSNGLDGEFSGRHVSLWPVGELAQRNADYGIARSLGGSIGVGTDGASACYALDYRSAPQPSVITCPLGDLAP